MAESEIFGIEAGFAEQAIEWMNNEAKNTNSSLRLGRIITR